jgi:hypothetical protein
VAKNVNVWLLVVILLLAGGLFYVWGRAQNQKEIARVELEREHMKATRDSLISIVDAREEEIQSLEVQIESQLLTANLLRAEVDSLEETRAAAQLSVRMLRQPADLTRRFEDTFPEVAGSSWGVTEIYDPEIDGSFDYIILPLWFSETFIIDHQNSLNFEDQRDKLRDLDTLNQQVIALKDSVIYLERENKLAYRFGYNEAYEKYLALNEKYVEYLRKPRPLSFSRLLTAAGVGVLVGTQLDK